MMVNLNLKRNINLFYIYSFIGGMQLYGPIFALFFQSFSLNQTQILSFLSVYAVSTIIFEIPTGILSDYIGRKKTMLISSILLASSFFVFSFGGEYWHFIIAYLIMGLASSFSSGTDQSFLYDTLLNLKLEEKFKKIIGKAGFFASLSLMLSMAVGGFLFTLNKQLPYLLTAIIASLNILIVLFFIEPDRTKASKDLFKHTKASFKLFRTNKVFLFLSLFSVITAGAIVVSYFLVQQYYMLIGISASLIGITIVGSKFIESLLAKYSYKIEEILKIKFSLILISTFIVVGYLLMSLYSFILAFVFVYFLSIASGFSGPALSDYINKHISSDKRATILSIKNQLKNVVFLIVPPLIGRVADVSIQLAFKVMAVSAAILYIIVIYYLIRLINLKRYSD